MARYVLLFRGNAARQADFDLIEQSAGVTIVDHSATRAMLIDAPDHAAAQLRAKLDNWIVAEEVTHAPPGPASHRLCGEADQDPE